jgi:hypothetical protein
MAGREHALAKLQMPRTSPPPLLLLMRIPDANF